MGEEKDLDRVLDAENKKELDIKVEEEFGIISPPISLTELIDPNFDEDLLSFAKSKDLAEATTNEIKKAKDIEGIIYTEKGKVYINGQLDMILEKICSERLTNFFNLRGIDENITRNLAMRRIVFEDNNKIIITSYDKKEYVYYDFETNKFEPEDNITDKSILIQGRNKSTIYLAVSLIEALSFLSIMYLRKQEYKEYTILVTNDNLKIVDYYLRKINDVKVIFMLGDYWSNDVKRKLENSKKKHQIKYISPVENTLNEDLRFIKGSSV